MVDNIEFNEPKISTVSFVVGGNRSGWEGKAVGFVRDLLGGLVKNDRQAKYVVFVAVSFFLAIALYYFVQSFSSPETKEVLKSIRA